MLLGMSQCGRGDVLLVLVGLGSVALLGLTGCGSDDCDSGSPSSSAPIVFSAEGEDLNAYDADTLEKQVVISGNEDESKPNIPAVNGQVCFDPTTRGRFVLADDYTQPNPPPHWTVLQLSGEHVGALGYTKLGELHPTYQGGIETADPVGCAFLPDGRLLTSDIGNNQSGPTNGQVTLWFTPLTGGTPRYCKLDVSIGTAGQLLVDDQQRVYVASARGAPGIYRFTGPFPTGDTAAGGCGGVDPTGAPLADHVDKELFIPGDPNIPTPAHIVASGHGTFYVSSVLNGVIAEYDADAHFVRRVLQPPNGEHVGTTPISTGSPLGIAIDARGTIYYADLALVIGPGGIGPGRRLGTVRRIRFEDGEPLPPETIDSGLRFPDGLGVFE